MAPFLEFTAIFIFDLTKAASHFLKEEGRRSLTLLVILPVGTSTGVTAAATATELTLVAATVATVATAAFEGGGTQTIVSIRESFDEGETG